MHEQGHFGSSVLTHMKKEISPYINGKNGLLTNPVRFLSITFTLGIVSVISVSALNGIGAYLKDEL
jgi:hypothetical protein